MLLTLDNVCKKPGKEESEDRLAKEGIIPAKSRFTG